MLPVITWAWDLLHNRAKECFEVGAKSVQGSLCYTVAANRLENRKLDLIIRSVEIDKEVVDFVEDLG